jgi:hypothetical protein
LIFGEALIESGRVAQRDEMVRFKAGNAALGGSMGKFSAAEAGHFSR